MLSDDVKQLLTAYVDGEVTDRQREAVLRLLNQSSEAREFLKKLQEDAHRLKKLPKHKVEPSLVEDVLEAIAESKAQPKPASAPRRARRRWLPIVAAGAMAASLMLAACGVVAWQALSHLFDMPNVNNIVKNDDKAADPKPDPRESTPEPDPTPKPRRENPLLASITNGTYNGFGAPVIPEKPFSASFAELKKDGKSTIQFARELNREKAVQLDVTVKKNSDAMARLTNVLKNHGVKLIADPKAAKPLDDKKIEYFVYAENLTGDQLTKLINELGDSYVIGLNNKQKTVPTPFQKATVTPLESETKTNVAKLLGVDPATMDRNDAKPAAKNEPTVVILPGSASGQPSAEVRQFASQRHGPQPGAVQILIKIRQE